MNGKLLPARVVLQSLRRCWCSSIKLPAIKQPHQQHASGEAYGLAFEIPPVVRSLPINKQNKNFRVVVLSLRLSIGFAKAVIKATHPFVCSVK